MIYAVIITTTIIIIIMMMMMEEEVSNIWNGGRDERKERNIDLPVTEALLEKEPGAVIMATPHSTSKAPAVIM